MIFLTLIRRLTPLSRAYMAVCYGTITWPEQSRVRQSHVGRTPDSEHGSSGSVTTRDRSEPKVRPQCDRCDIELYYISTRLSNYSVQSCRLNGTNEHYIDWIELREL